MSLQRFAKRLAQLRREKAALEERDIDHKAIAKAVGASVASVSRWESGEVFPGDAYLKKLAEYYGVTRAWLRYEEGERDYGIPNPSKDIFRSGPKEKAKPKATRPATRAG